MPPRDNNLQDLQLQYAANVSSSTYVASATSQPHITTATFTEAYPQFSQSTAGDDVADSSGWMSQWLGERVHADGAYIDVDVVGQRVRTEMQGILDEYLRRIYRVISEHCVIDISEDQFMKLIKEEK